MPVGDGPNLDVDLSAARFGQGIPFDTFAELRRRAPLYWHEAEESWLVTSYQLLGDINRDTARFSSWGGPAPGPPGKQSLSTRTGLTILTMDPPRHGHYRRLISGAFTPHAIDRLEGQTVRPVVGELLRAFVDRGGGDFVTDFAAPVGLRVIGQMMGIDDTDDDRIVVWTNAIAGGSDPEYAPDGSAGIAAAERAFLEYAGRLLDEHRSRPRGDLVDRLLDARVDGDPLTEIELRPWLVMLINGGAETTRHLLTNGLIALLEWPEERRRMVQGADIALAVEEMLRFTTPVMSHSRWPTETVEMNGRRIQPGQRTILWMLSANRDEAAFERPDTFDVCRHPNRHDSLGAGGPHYCIGAGLARLEARVVFDQLRRYLDGIVLSGPPERAQNAMFNAIKHLPVTVG